jgi:hypothetical protein
LATVANDKRKKINEMLIDRQRVVRAVTGEDLKENQTKYCAYIRTKDTLQRYGRVLLDSPVEVNNECLHDKCCARNSGYE